MKRLYDRSAAGCPGRPDRSGPRSNRRRNAPCTSGRKATRPPPSLAGVTWADAPITWEALRGKTVIILVYAPHPDAEQWAAPFFEKLKKAIRDKPIVVLAIDASKNGDAEFAYAKAKGCSAPNIILGRDPAMPARLGTRMRVFRIRLVSIRKAKLTVATFAGVRAGAPGREPSSKFRPDRVAGRSVPKIASTRAVSTC